MYITFEFHLRPKRHQNSMSHCMPLSGHEQVSDQFKSINCKK